MRRELGLLQRVAHDAVPAGHGVAVLDAAQLLLGDEPVVEAEPERHETIRGAERELVVAPYDPLVSGCFSAILVL